MKDTELSVVFFGNIPKTMVRAISGQEFKSKSITDFDKLNDYFLTNTVDICILSDEELSQTDKNNLIEFNPNSTFVILTKSNTRLSKNRIYYINTQLLEDTKLLNIFLSSLISNVINFRNHGDFSAMLLHDTRSPVNSIIGYLELLDNGVFGKLNDGQKQIIENTMILGDMLLDIIEDFNYMRQYENRNFKLNMVPFNIKEILDEALLSIWVQSDQKNIKVHINVDRNLPKIYGDAGKIQRVIINLLHNAIKFSPERSTVTIAVNKIENQEVQVSISDSGPGFNENYKEFIFDKYFTVKQRRGDKNFGLGLYIAKSIIDAHKGKIWVENNSNGGSNFYFQLKSTAEKN
ncbi:sensor histidine kinase [Calditrichota bacterium]